MHRKKTTSELEAERQADGLKRPRFPVTIVLDQVRSGLNVGSIFRSADAFHMQEIVCCGITPVPPQREVLKSALGSTETVPWRYMDSALDCVLELRRRGVQCWAIEQAANSVKLHDLVWDQSTPYACVFGNEVDGVHQDVIDACHGVIEIDQFGTKHSLNVAVSAGLIMHRFTA